MFVWAAHGKTAAAFTVLVLIATFAFFHSGPRASSLCDREGLFSDGSLSLWPPGATCTYGEPARSDTVIDGVFVPAAAGILLLGFGGAAIASNVRRRSS